VLSAEGMIMNWITSSVCPNNASCVEVAWHTASECPNGNSCVEIAEHGAEVLVRDGKLGDGSPVLTFTGAEWRVFVAGVRNGEFDGPDGEGADEH
jgi:Domain of unknown function (DUF397)